MNCFFTLIYIIPNRFSEEKIVVGILANLNGIPEFAVSDRKLNFALTGFSAELKAAIRRGFRFMDFDVNKIKRGEVALSLFDPPYSKKLLKALAHKKRGVVRYSEVFEIDAEKAQNITFEKLFKKFTGEVLLKKEPRKKQLSFKARFKEYTTGKRFAGFSLNYKLEANVYPFIYKDMTVDLLRKTNYYTVFYSIDFSSSIQTIQVNISRFRLIVQSLQQISSREGLSSGRYYMVYESTSSRSKQALVNTIKAEKNLGYEIIRISEVKDKI